MALTDRLTTLGKAMKAAEKTVSGPWEFETDDKHNPRIIPIPVSLDDRKSVLIRMQNELVQIETDIVKLETERDSIKEQIFNHKVSLSREMLSLGIPAPMAKEDLPVSPPTIPGSKEDD